MGLTVLDMSPSHTVSTMSAARANMVAVIVEDNYIQLKVYSSASAGLF